MVNHPNLQKNKYNLLAKMKRNQYLFCSERNQYYVALVAFKCSVGKYYHHYVKVHTIREASWRTPYRVQKMMHLKTFWTICHLCYLMPWSTWMTLESTILYKQCCTTWIRSWYLQPISEWSYKLQATFKTSYTQQMGQVIVGKGPWGFNYCKPRPYF